MRGRIFLGGGGFIEKFKGLLRAKQGTKEIPRPQRYVTRPLLRELFSEEGMRSKRLKDEMIFRAYSHYGYTLREIGEYLGVHYATVSRAVRRIERQ